MRAFRLVPTVSSHPLLAVVLGLVACGGDSLPPLEEGALRINEVMSDNQGAHFDSAHEADDYIELVNADTRPIQLSGYSLQDKSGANGRLPSRVLAPGHSFVVFADATPEQGSRHMPFKLGADGDQLVLRTALREYDRVTIPPLEVNHVFARTPHAEGPFIVCNRPSPGRTNFACGAAK